MRTAKFLAGKLKKYLLAYLTLTVSSSWPIFGNNGHQCALHQQQKQTSAYPTEYRVEIFSPPYMSADARPTITSSPPAVGYNSTFQVQATLSGISVKGKTQVVLSHPGFHTHGVAMGQRMVMMEFAPVADTASIQVTSPSNASVMPPGVYLLFVVNNGIPSEGVWIKLSS